MAPEDARAELQQLPGIGPFYSSLIVIRACGHADAPTLESPDHGLRSSRLTALIMSSADREMLALAETWRPFRTWVAVMMRALTAAISGAARASRALDPPTSSSLAEEKAPLLPPPQHGGRAISDARSSAAQ